jgi:hypothetical protein
MEGFDAANLLTTTIRAILLLAAAAGFADRSGVASALRSRHAPASAQAAVALRVGRPAPDDTPRTFVPNGLPVIGNAWR